MNSIEKEIANNARKYKETMKLYQKLYKDIDVADFYNIPILTKNDLIGDQKDNSPFGSIVEEDISKVRRVHRTSGTSEQPLMLALTQNDIDNIIDTGKKAFFLCGLTDEDIVINCMNYCMWMGGFMDHQSLEATGATIIPYGVGNTENLIQMIRMLPNVCIHATPSYLSKIEQVAKNKFDLEPADLHIKKGFFGGEGGLDNKNFRQKIENKWKMDIYNANYGMSEVMSIIASEGKEKNGLHFVAADTVYPELYIEEEENVSNENIRIGAIGKLVLSNRCKESQPLIRYDTGDIIEILDVRNEKPVQHFKFNVVGRADDMIVVKGINFYPAVIRNVIASYKELTGNYQVQILREGIIDYVRLVIECGDVSKDVLKLIGKEISTVIRKKYFVSVDILFTEEIEKDDNKLKVIKKVEKFE